MTQLTLDLIVIGAPPLLTLISTWVAVRASQRARYAACDAERTLAAIRLRLGEDGALEELRRLNNACVNAGHKHRLVMPLLRQGVYRDAADVPLRLPR